MGTSQSSSGSPSGVPMVPPWVPDVNAPTSGSGSADAESQDGAAATADTNMSSSDGTEGNPSSQQNIPIAPAGRFANTRRSLGEFARSGSTTSMRRGVGRYIQVGYGGGGTATRRFGGTARTADALYSALGGGAGGGAGFAVTPPQSSIISSDQVLTSRRSADDLMDAVVEAVRPVDGTQDTEASRAAIKDALAELLTRFPDADLLFLEEQQREFAIERYVAADVFRRFDLDVGKAIKDKAPSAATALGRLKEVRDYIRETVSASFRNLRQAGHKFGAGKIADIVQNALRETFKVFEDYAE